MMAETIEPDDPTGWVVVYLVAVLAIEAGAALVWWVLT